MSGRLEGKVTVITGAGSGLGAEAARLFAREGAAVAVNDVDEANGKAVVADIEAAGGTATFVPGDVRRAADVRAMYEAVRDRYGRITTLYNNAGVMPDDDGSVLDTTEAVFDFVVGVNLKGVFLCCQHGIPHLLDAGGGSIINVASFVATMGAATSQSAYTASKGGVLALTREIAVEFARQGIRANALSPGPIETPLLQKLLATEAARAKRLVHIPMGRFGRADDIAKAALFLASDDASFVTGANFLVDGGITAAYITPE